MQALYHSFHPERERRESTEALLHQLQPGQTGTFKSPKISMRNIWIESLGNSWHDAFSVLHFECILIYYTVGNVTTKTKCIETYLRHCAVGLLTFSI